MSVLKTISGLLLFLSLSQVHAFPRKKLIDSVSGENGRTTSRLASVLSDYWAQRGFHDASSDYLLASESQSVKARHIPNVKVSSFSRGNKVRIPTGRLIPPPRFTPSKTQHVVDKLTLALRNRQQRKRLVPVRQRSIYSSPFVGPAAQRKQDMEIMESVTLIDGGTPQLDGTIRVRPRVVQQSERKYHQDPVIGNIGPLHYHLQDADLTLPYRQQPQPNVVVKYNTLPFRGYVPNNLQEKLPHEQSRLSKVMSMSLHQFQQQQQQQEAQNQLSQRPQSTPKPQFSVYVVPTPTNLQQLSTSLAQSAPLPLPISSPTPHKVTTTPAALYPVEANPKEKTKSPLFQEQFQHPFATQAPPSPIRSLAQLTATLLSGASSVALATSAAASTFAKGVGALTAPAQSSSSLTFQNGVSSIPAPIPFQNYNAISPSNVEFGAGPLVGELHQAASIMSASQLRPPIAPSSLLPSVTPIEGVISNVEGLAQNQTVNQQESLVNKITQLVETGRKIIYFPKGVVDTVDVFLKQMERNPTVAYWGDKFFAKVFGDTSGT